VKERSKLVESEPEGWRCVEVEEVPGEISGL
jgi:hypothetical protein